MKYFIVAGEASGDLHGSNLISSLLKIDPKAEIVGYGGEKMEAAGMRLLHHYKDIAVMGFAKVVMKLRTVVRNLQECKQHVIKEKPDAVILIDFPGFNLKIAELAYKKGIKVYYYIAPKVWASRPKRVEKINQFTHKVFSILPFELAFFKKHNVDIEYVGNPLLDEIENRDNTETEVEFKKRVGLDQRPIIGLLAGSRKHEIKFNLPGMLDMIAHFPDFQFVIAGVPSLGKDTYQPYIQNKDVALIMNETYNILKHSHSAMVCSGTATLETALYNVPQLVCFNFDGGWVSYTVLKAVVKVKYISLVNLMLDKPVVTELIQKHFTHENTLNEMNLIVRSETHREKMQQDYQEIRDILGKPGASDRAARRIHELQKS